MLVLVLLTTVPFAAMAETFTTDVIMLYTMRTVTPLEIYASEEASGALAACAIADLSFYFNQAMSDHLQYALDHNLVYIGRSGSLLKVFFWAESGLVVLYYVDGARQVEVQVLSGGNATKDYVEYMMKYFYTQGVVTTYHHIDKFYIEDYLDYIYGRS